MNQEPEQEVVFSEEAEPTQEETSSAPASGRLTLKRSGLETDVEFTFGFPAVVGRFDPSHGPIDVDLGSIPEGSYVSRKHAKIQIDDFGQVQIVDMGSSNGTYVLGDSGDFEKVDASTLVDGQEIAFGNARFVFNLS